VIVHFDFFAVPTATFRLFYCLFVIEHRRRRSLHPSADWVVQQLPETFAEAAVSLRHSGSRFDLKRRCDCLS
jgi:hypothetical protein